MANSEGPIVKLKKVKYEELNGRAQEMYNFQKISAKLADYGFRSNWGQIFDVDRYVNE